MLRIESWFSSRIPTLNTKARDQDFWVHDFTAFAADQTNEPPKDVMLFSGTTAAKLQGLPLIESSTQGNKSLTGTHHVGSFSSPLKLPRKVKDSGTSSLVNSPRVSIVVSQSHRRQSVNRMTSPFWISLSSTWKFTPWSRFANFDSSTKIHLKW